jgi:hypothetical protein
MFRSQISPETPHHYHVSIEQNYIGDEKVLRKILSLLLHYSIVTTACGKITLNVGRAPEHPEQLNYSDNGYRHRYF